ncbi:hypothetical protein SAMN00017405_1755 [Desulfonispora thiosulfatigenes DSM 11270]|uniref:Pyridinium-3,5-bisthiocarboxylic acid mononucleotide nickel insertion protein n=1 Tax=Desulfonispora thiosulfatigenes DSM 11270 TaxID=656914 RepID=A0A1W1V389_DESTI|nr:nickel pincer cofactor biosynthesis protein LarC [Desulfonispora thiosulfatigenes]SMB87753.1 hypothetical protein SAMN00017405_1755 [Desulfonispora thiosulfatigenes DSM 11270]
MRTAYFDCFSGISGNMILGSFLGAGLDFAEFKESLKSLPIRDFEIEVIDVIKNGISAKYVDVKVLEKQPHRSLHDISEIINKSEFSQKVKDLALKIFMRLARAEAKVHGCQIEKVHFHEVGAVDAIIDILGAAYGFITLKLDKVYFSPLHVGGGMVKCAHGLMPVPAPATAELLLGTVTYSGQIKKELVTPTGAAIITTIGENIANQPMMKIKNISYGAGTWNLEIPNVVRLVLGEKVNKEINNDKMKDDDQILVLETNIDDMNSEFFGYTMDKLYEEGALEVYLTPIQMKKGRPGTLLSVICDLKNKQKLIEIILHETTTLGVRIYPVERFKLLREHKKVKLPYGEVRIKISRLENKIINIKPEFEDCKLIAQKEGIPLKLIWQKAYKLASQFD